MIWYVEFIPQCSVGEDKRTKAALRLTGRLKSNVAGAVPQPLGKAARHCPTPIPKSIPSPKGRP